MSLTTFRNYRPKIDLKLGQFEPLFKVRKKLKMSCFLNQLVNLNLLKGNYYKKWSLIMFKFDLGMIFWRCDFVVGATYGHAAMLRFERKKNTVRCRAIFAETTLISSEYTWQFETRCANSEKVTKLENYIILKVHFFLLIWSHCALCSAQWEKMPLFDA